MIGESRNKHNFNLIPKTQLNHISLTCNINHRSTTIIFWLCSVAITQILLMCFKIKNSCMLIIIVEKVFKSCFSTVLFYWEEQCHSKEEKVTWVYLQTIIDKTRFVIWTQITKTQFVWSQELILTSTIVLSCTQNAF